MNTRSRCVDNLVAYRKVVAFCFLALLLSFASLAPGGPVENRDFSHRGVRLFRRNPGDEVEFITLMWFDSIEAVRAFAG
jgi:hypothetical protein